MFRLYPYIAKKYWYFIAIWFGCMGLVSLANSNQVAFRVAIGTWLVYTVLWMVFVSKKNVQFSERRHQSNGRVCIYCGTDLQAMSDPSSCCFCHKPNKIA